VAGLSWAALLLYLAAAGRLAARGDTWPRWRAVCASGSAATLATAVLLPSILATGDLRLEIVQHLLMAMIAPALLALAAPLTLALRTLPRQPRRLVLRGVHSRYLRLVTSPPVLLVMDLGGLYLYYLTPLFDRAHHQAGIHLAIHLHMMVAGYLISAYLIGADPMPGRAGVRGRLLVLFLAAAGHDVLAKLMYARALPAVAGVDEGAQVMYYGGFAVELAVAVTMLMQWYQASGRAFARQTRRAAGHPYSPESIEVQV